MKRSSVISALLGVLVGCLLMAAIYSARSSVRKVSSGDWRKMDLVMEQIRDNYVDSVDFGELSESAIASVLADLDPHSVYMPPQELGESEADLAGNFEGIGIQFNVPNDTAIVIEVIPGGPSEKIGLRSGDRLLKVDSVVIAGVHYPQDSMVRRMKGPAGTKVTVTVGRGSEVIPFEITRGRIPVHSVDASFMVGDTTGYIRLSKFSRTTAKEFVLAASDLLSQGMTELIVDLRSNTGGYFDQALLLSNLFLDKGRDIVYMEGLHRSRESYHADGKGFLKDVALKVLIDEGSASSSEIFSGAMQDNDRGVIIGRRSFGKGLVQEPVYFSDGSGLRLTVARFYTPSGRCIQKPYTDDYQYDIYNRYADGEMVAADSIKVDTTRTFYTVGGRAVYGGGGIVPDVFVPIDTTRVTDFYMAASAKATPMRFASAFFDSHRDALSSISGYGELLEYLDKAHLDREFLGYARAKDGISPSSASEWARTAPYMMPQIRALVGRYSQLGDNAFYHLYMDYDRVMEEALKPHHISLGETVTASGGSQLEGEPVRKENKTN